jgi:hypothetical protein
MQTVIAPYLIPTGECASGVGGLKLSSGEISTVDDEMISMMTLLTIRYANTFTLGRPKQHGKILGIMTAHLLCFTRSVLVRATIEASHLIIQNAFEKNIQHGLGFSRDSLSKGQGDNMLLLVITDISRFLAVQGKIMSYTNKRMIVVQDIPITLTVS